MSKISRKLKKNKRAGTPTEPLLQKAIAYFKARNWEAADAVCRDILRKTPSNHKALNLLSIILTNKPDYAQAEKHVRKAIQIKANEPVYYSNLGLILKEQEKWEASFRAFEKACTLNPRDDESHYNLGILNQTLRKREQAKECYQKAIAINPNHIQASCALCNLLSRQSENVEELNSVMQHMEALLSNPDIPAREQIYFELARVHDKLGNDEKVFKFLEPANRIFRDKFNYDVESELQLFQSIARNFSHDILANKRGSGSDDPSPIFILGMPRSGTTLVEQILASHSQVAAGGELYFLNTLLLRSDHLAVPFRPDTPRKPNYGKIALVSTSDLNDLAEAYIQATAPLQEGKKHLTDKMPHNFIHVGMIQLLFPNSRVIHCRRQPMDNCLSLYFQNFRVSHPYIYSQKEIGRYYVGYRLLMDHWQNLLAGFIHEVRYEVLVNNPEQETRKLLEFCGLEWEDACLEFYTLDRYIKTASEGQADQPLYTSSIDRWKRYEKHLQPLYRIVKEAGLLQK